jgi:AraC-like DNA-binding protein
MDLHKASDYDSKPTVDDIKRNHIADLAVQHKYGVKFLQYWINEEAGLVFCLMEAPDKESCAAVHQEAHGGMPCNVIELKGGDYKTYMGDSIVNDFDIVENEEGKLDTGFRIIMVVDELSVALETSTDFGSKIKEANGRIINLPGHRRIVFFSDAASAIQCALGLIKPNDNSSSEIRIGITAGAPVTDGNDFFGDAIHSANRLCDIAQESHVVISPLVFDLCEEAAMQKLKNEDSIKLLDLETEKFCHLLVEKLSSKLDEAGFSIDSLCKQIGLSRSQLYRKITELTGTSANTFINEQRMQKALRLLQTKSGNVTQVALEVGYANPSYFSKNFHKRFGILPNKISRTQD